MAAPRPHLIPRVALELGGVVNVRGEPLPAVDGGALLTGRSALRHRHMLVLERGSLRLGVLVGAVQRIESALALARGRRAAARRRAGGMGHGRGADRSDWSIPKV